MPKKKRFNPVITRVKLNPEQAVLFCQGYSQGYIRSETYDTFNVITCFGYVRTQFTPAYFQNAQYVGPSS